MAALTLGTACTTTTGAPPVIGVSTAPERPAATFTFESLDENAVSSDAFRGRPTVLVFLSVTSIRGQAEANFLIQMAAHDQGTVAYALVSIDGRDSRELAEIYRSKLNLPFPLAMADDATRAGESFFGDVNHEPVVVVLDRQMRPVFRAEGRIVRSDEIRSHMRGL